MGYNVIVSRRAILEIENAIAYYARNSAIAPVRFIKNIDSAFQLLESTPNYPVRYKNVRSIRIKRFPYSLFYVINEGRNVVRVLSCFHDKRNPAKRPDQDEKNK